jgi:cyclopropane fatty-acyl-phospholipid synthase-like methyltransferase
MGQWYEDWFSSEEYLSVYRHRDEKDAGVLTQLILDKTCLQPGSEILDIACGSGRHSISFAQKGYSVTGIDLSSKLLENAENTAGKLGLKIDFRSADMRSFQLGKKFDLACNLFTSFGFFERDEDNFAVFTNAYRHLKKEAYFVLDYFNSYRLRKDIAPITIENLDNKEILQRRFIEGGRIYKEIIIKKNGTCKNYWESVKLYTAEEIRNNLEMTGFKVNCVLGDYEGNNFIVDKSSRLIIFAVK